MKLTLIRQKNSGGFTLVEIMIAIAISMILMLGVMQIFSSNKRSHVISNGLARVQENIRFAMKDISYAGRMAGYVGCGSGNFKNHLNPSGTGYSDDLYNLNSATGGWDFSNGDETNGATKPTQSYTLSANPVPAAAADLNLWDNNSNEDLQAKFADKVLPGTDVLVLKWAGGDLSNVEIKNMNKNSNSINTMNAHGVPQDTILIVSDCSGADAFMTTSNASSSSLTKGTASGHDPGNLNNSKWSHIYPKSADFLYFISRAYYIGEGASGEPALYRMTFTQGNHVQTVDEIAEGVENLQVLFGIDVNADDYADRYVTAMDVTSHDAVVSLKLALLARTPDEVKESASPNNYNLLGTTITTPSDRRLRYAFNTTIKLRNKGKK